MASLVAFRKRMWSLLSPNSLESYEETRTIVTAHESRRGTKRKLSSSPEREIESGLKRLKLEEIDIKHEGIDTDFSMAQKSIEGESLRPSDPAKVEENEPTEQNSSRKRSPRTRESIVEELYDYESDEASEQHEIQEEKEDIWEDYKIEAVEHVTAEDEDFKGWSKQELDFFNHLNDRGVVPMLWSYWKIDFPTLPENLFTPKKEDAIISNWKGNASAGAKAFNALVQAGSYARERQQRGLNAAQLLAREINSHIQWSFRDARLNKDDYIPLIVVNFAYKKEDLEQTDARTQSRVRKLSEQYRQLWDAAEPKFESSPPTIFHIFIARTVMGFGSYDTSAEHPEFRNIFFTDWKQRGNDVWNAMAIALLVQQTRSWLVQVDPKKKREGKITEVDPDL